LTGQISGNKSWKLFLKGDAKMHAGKDSSGAGWGGILCKVKPFKWILIIAAVFILLLFLGIPAYLSSDSGKEFIVSRINRSIDGTVAMGDFSMGWFKGVRVSKLSFEDNAGTTSVNVKEISTKPCYGLLLFGSVALGETLIDEPEVVINVRDGPRNMAGATALSHKKPPAKKEKDNGLALAKIDLTVKGGGLTINPALEDKDVKVLKVSNIESKVNLNPLGKKSTFDVALAVADGEAESKISAQGSVKPATKKSWTLKGTSGDFTVKVDNLDLASLGPLFALAGRDVDASGVLNADITARIDGGRFEELQAKAVLSDFKKEISGKSAALAEPVKIEAEISSDKKDIRIDRLNIESSFCRVDCKGGVNSVDYVATADLAGLQSFAGQFVDLEGYNVAGTVIENGSISFKNGTITARGQGEIQDFVLSDDKQSTPKTSVKMNFDVQVDTERDILKITSVKTAADIGQVQITDSVVPLGEGAKQELGLVIKADVDLKKARPFADLFVPLPEGMEISGRALSDVSVSKKKGKFNIVIDATSVKNFKLRQAGREPFEEKEVKLVLDMTCDAAEKTIAINNLRVDSSHIKITKGTFSQSSKKGRTKLAGELEAEYDLAAVSKAASAFIPQGLEMEGKRKTKVKIESVYPEGEEGALAANLNTEAKFGFDKARYKGLNFGPTEMKIKVKGGLLTIEPFTAPVNNGKMNFATNFDLSKTPAILQVPTPIKMIDKVEVTDEMSNRMLMYLNPTFANQVGVSGVGNLKCDKFLFPIGEGTKKDIEIKATVWIDDLRLKPMGLPGAIFTNQGEFKLEKTDFVLQKGLLSYDNMQLNIGDNPVNFSGNIDIEKETYTLKIILPYTLDRKTVHVGDKVGNRIETQHSGNIRDGLDWKKIVAAAMKQVGEHYLKEKAREYLDDETIKQGLELLEKVLK